GIYVVATDGSGSVLLLGGDWSTAPGEQVQPTWTDPQQHDAPARSYYLPQVSFSPDGDYLAVVTNTTIDLGTTAGLDGASHHVGACPRWAWSAGDGSAFVAGCDQLTTAWYVDVANGPITGQSVALPQPNLDIAVPGWESIGAGSIGIDGDGQIVVARFYGLPVGCEDNPCQIPSPAWTVSTIDPAGGKTTSRGAVSDFLVGSEVLDHGLLAPHGDWLYADIDGGRARTIRLSDGTVTKTSSIGRIAGASRDGSLLYGSLPDDATGHVRVSSIDALGGRHLVTTIEWPAGGVAGALAIGVFGLVAG
ncbi:MAG TPA: hypothetical protein VF484_00575, partial [Candidatus Limnocylindrales bacterium]